MKEMLRYENCYWRVMLSMDGAVTSISGMDTGCVYPIQDSGLNVILGSYNNKRRFLYSTMQETAGCTEYIFTAAADGCIIRLIYRFFRDKSFFYRVLAITPEMDTTISEVSYGACFNGIMPEAIPVSTFWNASAAVFLRFADSGLFTGFANPFFRCDFNDNYIQVLYAPAWNLNAGETYTSDEQFWGLTHLGGGVFTESIPMTGYRVNNRYHTRYRNPNGFSGITKNESRAFSDYINHHFKPAKEHFELVFYMYWTPVPQPVATEEDEQAYYRLIDVFASLGGSRIILTPLQPYEPPSCEDDSVWTLAEPGTASRRVLDYAISKGLKAGYYTGSAAGHQDHCNSWMVTYDKENSGGWNKTDYAGNVSTENCIADDSFMEWFLLAQKRTITRYGLDMWGWDPGPGNGLFCYNPRHGHLPGKGGYRGWRNAMAVIGQLSEWHPDIYIQGFHGTKEYGVWGQRYTDQHEAYWEQKPGQMSMLIPDPSADRLTANGVRQQAAWCSWFCYLPATQNHALAHRMFQSCHSGLMFGEDFDWEGAEYAFLSALSTGAWVTFPIIPRTLDTVHGKKYLAFVSKWRKWAEDNWDSAPDTRFFTGTPTPGMIDGSARIKDNKGWIFLFNPNAWEITFTLEIGEPIGVDKDCGYIAEYAYPWEGGCITASDTVSATANNAAISNAEVTRGVAVRFGDVADVPVPARQAVVLHIFPDDNHVRHSGRGGTLTRHDNGDVYLDGVSGKPGMTGVYGFPQCRKAVINGKEATLKDGKALIRFNGEKLPRLLCLKTSAGKLSPGSILPAGTATLHGAFIASSEIRRLLELAALDHSDINAHIEKIEYLRTKQPADSYIWAQPYRLFLSFPFPDAEAAELLELSINGKMCCVRNSSTCIYGNEIRYMYYADITQHVVWGSENRLAAICRMRRETVWSGAVLEYPDEPETCDFTITDEPDIIYSNIALFTQPDRKAFTGSGTRPQVISAWTDSPFETMCDTMVYADVNLPYEDLEGVYLAAQVNIDQRGRQSVFSDIAMKYDQDTRRWYHKIQMGNRKLTIIDAPALHIWCITRDGTVSEDYTLEINWRLH